MTKAGIRPGFVEDGSDHLVDVSLASVESIGILREP